MTFPEFIQLVRDPSEFGVFTYHSQQQNRVSHILLAKSCTHCRCSADNTDFHTCNSQILLMELWSGSEKNPHYQTPAHNNWCLYFQFRATKLRPFMSPPTAVERRWFLKFQWFLRSQDNCDDPAWDTFNFNHCMIVITLTPPRKCHHFPYLVHLLCSLENFINTATPHGYLFRFSLAQDIKYGFKPANTPFVSLRHISLQQWCL